ncbi:hypothetical protein [Caballeronia sp. LZ001]|nr:hypothetical protein [Caballeronia sp. LZ001]MDR5802000.1 hypothetical protein [Caballeronia sp. LZ001]
MKRLSGAALLLAALVCALASSGCASGTAGASGNERAGAADPVMKGSY